MLLHGEEIEANARERLEDISSQGLGCRPGAYGRKLQFADPEFPPDNASVGNAQCRQQLASQWKVNTCVDMCRRVLVCALWVTKFMLVCDVHLCVVLL